MSPVALNKVGKYLEPIREKVFPFISKDHVKIVDEDGFQRVEFGPYCFYPVEDAIRTIGGLRSCIKWNMTVEKIIHGSFNPFNGGYPDDVEEVDLGQFDSIFNCLSEVGRIECSNKIDSVCESIDYEEMAKADEDYEKWLDEHPPEPQLCPHNKEWHECNACMDASDLAYDAARENRFR